MHMPEIGGKHRQASRWILASLVPMGEYLNSKAMAKIV